MSEVSNADTVARSVVMIYPQSFQSNPETQKSNSFQKAQKNEQGNLILKNAQNEFAFFKKKLTDAGINVHLFTEDIAQATPDAIFPNNWFCHLPDGRIFLFPMQAENRRREVRRDIIQSFSYTELVDMTTQAQKNEFLEGTGSLIFDHQNKTAYACLSPRTTINALKQFSILSGYEIISFTSNDQNGKPIYHTNVMMSLGPKTAVINLQSISDLFERNHVIRSLQNSQREIVDISFDQMNQFAGNILFLKNNLDQTFWVCSSKAHNAFTEKNKKILQQEGSFLSAPLDTIENYGGGGARCLLAEIFE